jgi:hypothetical protein
LFVIQLTLFIGGMVPALVVSSVFGAIAGAIFTYDQNARQKKIRGIIGNHAETLARKRRQLIIRDDYGNVDLAKWKQEIGYFISNIVNKFLAEKDLDTCSKKEREWLSSFIDEVARKTKLDTDGTFDPAIDPFEYEHFCAEILKRHGWEAHATQATGDQGVDVIASKDGLKGAIQCKRYSSPVGNKAVQEVYSGMRFIGGNFSAVVTNAGFTRSAKVLAQSLGVHLLHHDELKSIEERLSNSNRST